MTFFLGQQKELRDLISRWASHDGAHETAIGALTLHRQAAPTEPVYAAYQPSFAFIVQGAKNIILGNDILRYDSTQFLLTSVDLPVVTQVIEASPEAPFLCFLLNIDMQHVAELISQGNIPLPKALPATRGMTVSQVSAELLDASIRLLRLLDTPADIGLLGPMIQREITFRLLTGPEGARLRHMAVARSQSHHIGQVISWIRRHFTQPLRIDELASRANMSMSSLHHHFKSITAMTPMQYQKLLRLQEARRLMLIDMVDVGTAGYRVGYESESQFSREYSRQYGRAPGRDVGQVRAKLLHDAQSRPAAN